MTENENLENLSQEEKTTINNEINIDSKAIVDELKKINNNIHDLQGKAAMEEIDNSINYNNHSTTAELTDINNKKLNDYELSKRVLNQIKIDKEQGKNIPIEPVFIEFLEKMVKHVEEGGNIQEFKTKGIYQKTDWNTVKGIIK